MRYIDETEAEKRFSDELDELYPVEIGGMSFCASRVLQELDPIAYNCALADWLDANDLTTDLISFIVELVEEGAEEDEDGETTKTLFQCEAEDEDHAREQAEDAYKNCEVLEIEEA